MTAPLTPPDSDLQDFPFMPLHVARLRDSDLASEERPEACWYAVLLWAASWHQLPAGSLPDNDVVLTKLIGLGRDVRTFRKHKEGAMRGFIKCDDGRLYHPVVAEQVLEGWERKRQQRWRSELARIKKANQRNGTALPSPTYEQFLAGVSPDPDAPGPRSVPEDSAECPSGQTVQETGTGTGTPKKEANASSVAEPTKSTKRSYPDDFEAAWKAYPHHNGRSAKPKAAALFAKLPADERAGMVGAIQRFAPNVAEACGGKGAPGMHYWLADGKHLNWQGEDVTASAPEAVFDGPPDIRAWAAAQLGEPYARSYVDPARWDAENRALLAANPFAVSKLARDLADITGRWKFTVRLATANDPKPTDLFAQTGAAA